MSWIQIALVFVLQACGGTPTPWWQQGEAGCPDGATLRGEAWPAGESVTTPDDSTLGYPTRRLWCGRGEASTARHGRSIAWFDNGQVAHEATYEDGQLVELVGYDPWGRQIHRLVAGESVFERTWWYADGRKAVVGQVRDGLPDGTWIEWDRSGDELGRIAFAAGVPGEVTGAPRLLPTASQALDPNPMVQPSSSLDLPRTPSVEAPPVAVSVAIERERIAVNGVPAVALHQGRIPAEQLRGQLVSPLYDQLLTEAETAKLLARKTGEPSLAFTGEVLVLGDARTPYSVLLPVLYTAGQAEFGTFLFPTTPGELQWPPTTGPRQLQGVQPLGHLRVGLPDLTDGPGAPPPSLSRLLGTVDSFPPDELPPPPTSVHIEATGTTLRGPGLEITFPCSTRGCPTPDSRDHAALVATLDAHAQARSTEEPLVLVPDPDIDLQTLAGTVYAVQQVWPSVVLAGGAW